MAAVFNIHCIAMDVSEQLAESGTIAVTSSTTADKEQMHSQLRVYQNKPKQTRGIRQRLTGGSRDERLERSALGEVPRARVPFCSGGRAAENGGAAAERLSCAAAELPRRLLLLLACGPAT